MKCQQKGGITHEEKLFAEGTKRLYSLKSQIVINILKNTEEVQSNQLNDLHLRLKRKNTWSFFPSVMSLCMIR